MPCDIPVRDLGGYREMGPRHHLHERMGQRLQCQCYHPFRAMGIGHMDVGQSDDFARHAKLASRHRPKRPRLAARCMAPVTRAIQYPNKNAGLSPRWRTVRCPAQYVIDNGLRGPKTADTRNCCTSWMPSKSKLDSPTAQLKWRHLLPAILKQLRWLPCNSPNRGTRGCK